MLIHREQVVYEFCGWCFEALSNGNEKI